MPTSAEIDLFTDLKAAFARRAAELRAKGVSEAALIGSRARGTATARSDIDLLLDLTPDATFGLLDLVTLKDDLETALGHKIDIAFKSSLRPYIKARMLRDARALL